MRRRDAIALVGAAFLAAASTAAAQQSGERIYRLGQLASADSSVEVTRAITLPELARLGFREGRNLVFDSQAGDVAALPGLARELLRARPDAIIAIGPDAIRAAQDATRTVPIIMFGADPVGQGYAESLARPGGNVTGVAILAAELDGKRLDLLREAVPAARRVAALMMSSAPGRLASEREMRAVAASAGIELVLFDVVGPDDYQGAFSAMRAAGTQALIIMANPIFNRDGESLAARAMAARLPTVCEWADMARTGCVLGYGPDRFALRLRVADYAARIFRGAAPGDLPIEAPTNFEFAINLRTARALGLVIPPSIMLRADEVIE